MASPLPEFAVQGAVADGLGDVVLGDRLAAGEVGDGTGHAEDAVVGAGTQPQRLHRLFQRGLTRGVEPAVRAGLPRGHAAVEPSDPLAEPLRLKLARPEDLFAHPGAAGAVRGLRQVL